MSSKPEQANITMEEAKEIIKETDKDVKFEFCTICLNPSQSPMAKLTHPKYKQFRKLVDLVVDLVNERVMEQKKG